LVIAAGFVSVTAGLHIAPAATMVLGGIKKKPSTIFCGALTNQFERARGQQGGGISSDWPQDRCEGGVRSNPFPYESPICVHDPSMSGRVTQ
jgi:hypothetical protein